MNDPPGPGHYHGPYVQLQGQAVDSKMLIFGEVGLSGEVRAVSQASQRVNRSCQAGFTTCVLPKIYARIR